MSPTPLPTSSKLLAAVTIAVKQKKYPCVALRVRHRTCHIQRRVTFKSTRCQLPGEALLPVICRERERERCIPRVRAMKGQCAAVKKAKGGNFKEGGDKKATKAVKKAK